MAINFVKNELFKYGISSSGNIDSDIAALKKAKQSKGESTSDVDNFAQMIKSEQNAQGPKGKGMQVPPWGTMMQSLGIDPQGNPEADFAAIQSKIDELESSDLSTEQQANLNTLKAQFEKMKQMAEAHKNQKGEGAEGAEKGGKQRPQEAPWFSLMKTVGIQPQGSPQADFAAISNKLNQMQSTAVTAEQKANLQALQSQLEQYENSSF